MPPPGKSVWTSQGRVEKRRIKKKKAERRDDSEI